MQHLCRTQSPKCAGFIFLNKPAAEPGQSPQAGPAWQPHVLPWLLLCQAPAACTETLALERSSCCKTSCFVREWILTFLFLIKNEPFILPTVYYGVL